MPFWVFFQILGKFFHPPRKFFSTPTCGRSKGIAVYLLAHMCMCGKITCVCVLCYPAVFFSRLCVFFVCLFFVCLFFVLFVCCCFFFLPDAQEKLFSVTPPVEKIALDRKLCIGQNLWHIRQKMKTSWCKTQMETQNTNTCFSSSMCMVQCMTQCC